MLKCIIRTPSNFFNVIQFSSSRAGRRHSLMNKRDDFFYQAVIYAKEKNYAAARAMLRNLLFQNPNDIEGLLLYSIVAKNKEGSIQALKRILQIDQDHEIAFAKLATLKYAPPASIPTPTSPLPRPAPVVKTTPQPKAPEKVIPRKTPEPKKTIEQKNIPINKKTRKKKRTFDVVFVVSIGLLIITCLCISLMAAQKIFIFFLSGS